MTAQLPTLDDLHETFMCAAADDRIDSFTVARKAGITAVIDLLGAWGRVAVECRPIPEGWSNATPPDGELVLVSRGGYRSVQKFHGSDWAGLLNSAPTAIWHPLPTDPRVEP